MYDDKNQFQNFVHHKPFATLEEAEAFAAKCNGIWPTGTRKVVGLSLTVVAAAFAIFLVARANTISDVTPNSRFYSIADDKPYHGSVISGEFFPTVGTFCKHIYQTVAKAAALSNSQDDSNISTEVPGEATLHSSRVVVTKSAVQSGCKYDDLPDMRPMNFELVEVTVRDGNSEVDGQHGYVSDAFLKRQ